MNGNKITKAINNPIFAMKSGLRNVNRLFYSATIGDKNPSGIDIFAKDWDNLIILDACRADYIRKFEMDGEYQKVESSASTTWQFITNNFKGKKLHDTVYVSANAWFPKLSDKIESELHKFINLENYDCQDERTGIEPPSTVSKYAREAQKDYPNKRLIIHYIQPHYPFLGEIGQSNFDPGVNLLEAVTKANVSKEIVEAAYRENLELVLKEAVKLIDDLEGKSVITADHGEMLGERSLPIPFRDFGHPPVTYTKPLVEVPWIVFKSNSRKSITSESPETLKNNDMSKVNDRLEKLGYKL